MAGSARLFARRFLQLAATDAGALLPARALSALQCSCSYMFPEAYSAVHRRGFAKANTKEAEPLASTSWAARLLNRGAKQVSESAAPSTGKDAAKPGVNPRAKGATLVSARGGVSRNVDLLQTRKNMASVISPGLIAEPFKGEEPHVGWGCYLLRFVTPSGWRELKKDFMTTFKSGFAIAKFRRAHPGFNMAAFRDDALALYTEVCSALAAGDHSTLRQAATPKHYINLKKQLAARQEGGWARVAWGYAQQPSPYDIHLLQARLLMLDPKDERYAYAQFTVRFWSTHTFAAYDSRGKLVAGDPDRPLPVQDVWVLERALLPSSLARWRAAAQVHLPPVRPPRVTLRRRVSEWLRRRISSGEKPLEARQEEAKARSGSGGKGDARVSPLQQVPGARAVI